MKKLYYFFFIVFIFNVVIKTNGQGTIFLTPLKTEYVIRDMSWVNDTIGYALTLNERVLKTTNAGLTWDRADKFLPGITNTYSIFFTDANNGYITGNTSGVIYKTINGGNTWTNVYSGSTVVYNKIYFVTDSIGFTGGFNGTIRKTIDKGASWSGVTSGTTEDIYDIVFTGPLNGFACCSGGIILKTTDEGLTWNSITTPANDILYSLAASNDSMIYACGVSGRILKTVNYGITWDSLSSVLTNTSFRDIAVSGTDTLLLVTVGGDIVRSFNGGSNWTIASSGNQDLYCAGINHQNKFIVMGQGTMIYSVDAGATWPVFVEPVPYSQLRDIKCVSPTTIYVIGATGATGFNTNNTILKTTDAGKNWTTLQSYYSINIPNDACDFIDTLTGYVSNFPTGFRKTVNGGTSFTNLTNVTIPIYDLQFFNQNFGVGVGSLGTFCKTINGGTSWTYTNGITGLGVTRIQMLDSLVGYMSGYCSFVAKTIDGGITWNVLNTGVPCIDFNSLYFVNDSVGYVAGSGQCVKTIDGGQSWTIHPVSGDAVQMFFLTPDSGYLVMSDFAIRKTINGMASSSLIAPAPYYSFYITRADMKQNVIYGVGEEGNIFKYTLPISTTGINELSEAQIHEAIIYPNPANNEIHIYSTINFTVTEFILFDSEAKKVMHKKINSEASLSIAKLNAGIYFYVVRDKKGRKEYGRLVKE